MGANDATQRSFWSSLLVNAGTAVVLVPVLFILDRRLGEQIETVRQETRQQVGTLAERVETFERDVDRKLDDVAATVARRLEDERQRDTRAFGALSEEMTRDGLLDALLRARELGIVGDRRGPRVPVAEGADLFVRFEASSGAFEGERWPTLEVEPRTGGPTTAVAWAQGRDPADVLVELGRVVLRLASRDIDVRFVMRRLGETLDVGQRHHNSAILEICPPQWCITDTGLAVYSAGPGFTYGFPISALPRNAEHVFSKPWLDRDSFDAAYLSAGEI